MTNDVLLFFERLPSALPLYEYFERRVLSEIDDVHIKVQKTQITFSNRHQFACVSFLPVRKAAERPECYIVVTFGLRERLDSPRIDAATEPYPNRFTHHILIADMQEIDEELMAWVKAASVFSAGKR